MNRSFNPHPKDMFTMTQRRSFWIALMLGVLVFYATALGFVWQGHPEHPSVRLAGIFLLAHTLEIPLSMRMLRCR